MKYLIDLFSWKIQSEQLTSLLQQAANAALYKTVTEKGFQQSTLYGLQNLQFLKMAIVYLFRKGLQLLRRTWTSAAFSEASSSLTQVSNGLAEGLAMSLLLSKNESWFLSFLAELKTLNIITVSIWGWMCQEKVLFFTMAGTRNKVKRQGFSVA